jgi:hypothetical protein
VIKMKELENFKAFLAKLTGEEDEYGEDLLRFIWIEDPPHAYGFGLDTPALPLRGVTQYWVVPPFRKGWQVYSRKPINEGELGTWVLEDPFPFVKKGKNTGRRGRPQQRKNPYCRICNNLQGEVCDIWGDPCPYATSPHRKESE